MYKGMAGVGRIPTLITVSPAFLIPLTADSLSKIADTLVVGGGISNTFVAAAGNEVGNSLYEADLIPEAQCFSKET